MKKKKKQGGFTLHFQTEIPSRRSSRRRARSGVCAGYNAFRIVVLMGKKKKETAGMKGSQRGHSPGDHSGLYDKAPNEGVGYLSRNQVIRCATLRNEPPQHQPKPRGGGVGCFP